VLYNFQSFSKISIKDNMLRDNERRLFPLLKWGSMLLFGIALLGCGEPVETQKLSDESRMQLEKRVQQRWLAMVEHDFSTVWQYNTPNYRESFPNELFIHKFSYGVKWELTGVEVLTYDARAAVASVVARVMSEPTKLTSAASRAVGAVPVTVNERWINVDGQWWYSANF
jgi:hypothetical protein